MIQIKVIKPTNNKMIFSFDGKRNLARRGNSVTASKSNTYITK